MAIIPPWLFEPFSRVALETVGVWYAVSFLLTIGLAIASVPIIGKSNLLRRMVDSMGYPLSFFLLVVVTPVFEEVAFRIIPAHFIGGVEAVIYGSVIWVFLHGKRFFVLIPLAPVFIKLAAGGFYVEVIVLHAIHNAIALHLGLIFD